MILYHSADLIWATKIKGAAEALGFAARPVRSIEMLEARLADSPVVALIVDLDAPEVAIALVQRVRLNPMSPSVTSQRRIKVMAFGPHVAVAEMQAAKAAGADTVMARGAFSTRMSNVIKDLATGAAIADFAED